MWGDSCCAGIMRCGVVSGRAGLTDNRDSQKIPLYAHVAELAGTKQPFVLPVPFQNVINGGMSIHSINFVRKSVPCFYNEC